MSNIGMAVIALIFILLSFNKCVDNVKYRQCVLEQKGNCASEQSDSQRKASPNT